MDLEERIHKMKEIQVIKKYKNIYKIFVLILLL